MNNNTTSILIGAVIAAAFVAIIAYTAYTNKKRKDASWTGVVIDKAMQETVSRSNQTQQDGFSVNGMTLGGNNQSAVTHSYSITVRPDGGGEQFNWSISSGMYEQVAIGDTMSKKPGTQIPEIVQKAVVPPPVVPPQV